MGVPVSQMARVASYVVWQKLRGRQRYPLVLMLEPLYRCNLSCAGCGKIQYPKRVLRHQLSAEECLRAVDECPAPIVSIPGGEPLLHPEIDRIVEGLVARRKYIYLCTNAMILEEKLHLLRPSRYLSFSVHLDGLEEEHDASVCRPGTYRRARRAIEAALARGFRVTTNTTLFDGADPERTRAFFDEMADAGVEGMMVSPGYHYETAPDRDHFLQREQTRSLFRRILRRPSKRWRFNQSPLFLEFLAGARDYECTPWGSPSYGIFGWQKPCYLLQEGYERSFDDLLANTDWRRYGHASGNPKCRDCMVHSGFEPSSVDHGFSSLRGLFAMARATLLGPRIPETAPEPRHRAERRPAAPAPEVRGAPRAETDEALRAAFAYRGDVTLVLDDSSEVEGFVVDVCDDEVRLWRRGRTEAEQVAKKRVQRVAFTGRDFAANPARYAPAR